MSGAFPVMLVVKIKFGSHLYGTETPSSDHDYKSIVLPSARDIVLQRARQVYVENSRKKAAGEKNKPGDVDNEYFTLHRYLELLAEGQTIALDMLFAPDEALLSNSSIWREIRENRHRLLTKRSSAFVGYCRQQANKYGIKGSRVAAAREAKEFFEQLMVNTPPTFKLWSVEEDIRRFVNGRQHCAIVAIEGPIDKAPLNHLEVCGKKAPWTITLQQAYIMYARAYEEYGERSKLAEKNESIDWKAMSHAVRVGTEALELMRTGKITFPLPYRDHIRDIKLGKLGFKEVAAEVEELLALVEVAERSSILPDAVDYQWIDDFVYRHYRGQVALNGDGHSL